MAGRRTEAKAAKLLSGLKEAREAAHKRLYLCHREMTHQYQ